MAETPPPRPRWYRLTPGRLVVGLLAIEALLPFSEPFRWFPINEHKGWTVLMCVVGVGMVMFLMFVWFALALLFRWRFQFSLRSLLVLVVAVAIPCSWLAVEMDQARKQKEAVEAIEKAGGVVWYHYESDDSSVAIVGTEPTGPLWLRNLLGNDFFAEAESVDLGPTCMASASGEAAIIVSVRVGTDAVIERLQFIPHVRELCLNNSDITDAGLEALTRLRQLQWLQLDDTKITDAGLEHLKRMTQLQRLDLDSTQVTDEGVKELQQALPKCEIER
jgi:hypothetical protein